MMDKPTLKPKHPNFSCGPVKKRPGWSVEALQTALAGRSHRSQASIQRLDEVIKTSKKILQIPENYLVGIVPGSDTGAFEMALWSMLGARPVTVLAWDVFSGDWLTDIVTHLKLPHVDCRIGEPGYLPDMANISFDSDVVFAWCGTTAGVWLPNGDWIDPARKGLTFCDAVSAIYATPLPWHLLDVTTFSWQKGVGSEAAHGMIVLSPRAVERLLTYTPSWPLPKIFRLTDNGALKEGIFQGLTINTPSMLCVEDYLDALHWAEKMGLHELINRSRQNLNILEKWVKDRSWVDFVATDPKWRASTAMAIHFKAPEIAALPLEHQWDFVTKIATALLEEEAGYDLRGHASGTPCLRIWGGPTVEASDLEALLPWIEWAYHKFKPT